MRDLDKQCNSMLSASVQNKTKKYRRVAWVKKCEIQISTSVEHDIYLIIAVSN